MEGGGEFPGSFFSATSDQILLASAGAALEICVTQRASHHLSHGNEIDARIGPIFMSVTEMTALVEHFRPMAEAGELPDALCPLIIEIAHTLENHAVIMPMPGQHGDPDMN